MSMNAVHTYLYTDKAFKDLEAIREEALRATYGVTYSQVSGFDVSRAPDGEVIFIQNDNTPYCIRYVKNGAWKRGNAGFCKWLGCLIKRITVSHVKTSDWDSFSSKKLEMRWDTDDKYSYRSIRHQHSVSVADLHLYYDLLLNHKIKDSVYSKDAVKACVGKQLDPITTEIMTAKRDEINALNEAHKEAIQKLDEEYDEKRDALRKKTDKAKDEAAKKHEADLKAIEARYASIPAAV